MPYRQPLVTMAGIGGGLIVVLASCAEPPSQPVRNSDSPQLAASLTASALERLGPGGLFDVGEPDDIGRPQLTKMQAASLATVFGRNYAVHIRSALEAERAGAIAFSRLAPCGRILYASSPYEVTAGAEAVSSRNLFGPHWIVALCDGAEPQLSVSVAALATELRARNGLIEFPRESGNEFVPRAIPRSWDGPVGISAEQAVILAARQLGAKVNAVPRLVGAGAGWIPQAAQWQVQFERSIPIAKHGAVSGFYVGLRLDGKAAVGPAAVVVQLPMPTPVGSTAFGSSQDPALTTGVRPKGAIGREWKTAFTALSLEGRVP